MALAVRKTTDVAYADGLLRLFQLAAVRLIARRILQAIPVVIGVSFLTFTLLNLLPGTAAANLLSLDATPQQIHDLSVKLHLNDPFFVRYWHWLSSALAGHLGNSLENNQSVAQIIAQRLPVTFEVALVAFLLALVFAIPTALLAARKPLGLLDRASLGVSMAGLSIPPFALGLVLILIVSVHLQWLPAIGFTPLSHGLGPNLRTVILPSLTIAFGLFCTYSRLLRADLIDQLNAEEYIVAARAKGLSKYRVLVQHAFRNSLFGLITVVGLNLGVLISGTVIIEQVFALPGIGQELLTAIYNRDVITVQAIVLVFAASVVVANLLVDLCYLVLDPRIRYGRTGN